MMYLLLTTLFLSACGRESSPTVPPGEITTEMAGYIDVFTELAREHGVTVSQQLYSAKILDSKDWKAFTEEKSQPKTLGGLCTVIINPPKNRSFPGYKKEPIEIFRYVAVMRLRRIPQQKALIFHELGHCLLNMEHSQSGIMSEFIPFVKDEAALSEMMDEFFQSYKTKEGTN